MNLPLLDSIPYHSPMCSSKLSTWRCCSISLQPYPEITLDGRHRKDCEAQRTQRSWKQLVSGLSTLRSHQQTKSIAAAVHHLAALAAGSDCKIERTSATPGKNAAVMDSIRASTRTLNSNLERRVIPAMEDIDSTSQDISAALDSAFCLAEERNTRLIPLTIAYGVKLYL